MIEYIFCCHAPSCEYCAGTGVRVASISGLYPNREARQIIADEVQHFISEIDPADNGLWQCVNYSAIGAPLLTALFGMRFTPISVKPLYVVEPGEPEILHASGVPLNTPPSWATPEEVQTIGLAHHALIRNDLTRELIDFSVKPVIWDTAARLKSIKFEPLKDNRWLTEFSALDLWAKKTPDLLGRILPKILPLAPRREQIAILNRCQKAGVL